MSKLKARPGRPSLGRQKRRRLSISLKPDLVARLEASSKASGTPASRLAEELLEEALHRRALKLKVWELRLGLDKEQLAGYCKALGVKRLSLFGSVLTDRFRPDSDIDLLAEFLPGTIKSFMDRGHIHSEFERILGRKVDLTDPKGLDNPIRRREILSTAVEVYAAQ